LFDPKYLSWLKINHPEATSQPSFSFLPPSEQDILPASQNDYPEASQHNNGNGISLPCHSGLDASESPVLLLVLRKEAVLLALLRGLHQ